MNKRPGGILAVFQYLDCVVDAMEKAKSEVTLMVTKFLAQRPITKSKKQVTLVPVP